MFFAINVCYLGGFCLDTNLSMTIIMLGQKGLPARSGGIERHVQLLSKGLVARGHRVIAYGRRWYVQDERAPFGIEQRFSAGIKTKHLDAITHSFTALFDARRLKPEVIHIHGTGVALLAPLARLLIPKAKLVVTFHCKDRVLSKWGRFAKWAFYFGEWLACHWAHKTITVSQELVQYCQDVFGTQPVYITHPFEMSHQVPSEHWLEKHDLKTEGYFAAVNRLIPDKQMHILMDAYRSATEQQPELMKRFPLIIIGGGAWTDSYVRWLTQKAAAIPGVRMLGELTGDELKSLQAHALAHVFPTSSEGLALSMLEAAAYARPMIMTDLPQNREASGGAAIEVPAHNISALAQALIQVAQMDEFERWSMGDKAKKHVMRTFDFDDRVDDMLRVYSELCTGSAALVTILPIQLFQT